MLIFIDESGDCGMKLGKGSSPCFTLTAVLFRCHEEAGKCNARIETLGKRLFERDNRKEFHFTHCNDRQREEFFEAISTFEFEYYACRFEKNKLSGREWKKKNYFWERIVTSLAFLLPVDLCKVKTFVDRQDNVSIRKTIEKTLKFRLGMAGKEPVVKEVHHLRSHQNPLIQMADMVGGAVGRSFSGDVKYRNMVVHREGRVTMGP